jgi:hypothetical protein
VAAFHAHHIAVHGMFVLGLDTDTRASARDTTEFARLAGIDTLQMMVQTPLPGTRLWDRTQAEGRLITEDWSLFDGHHVVMRPEQMTALELQLSVLEAMKRFYSWPAILSSGITAVTRQLPALARLAARPAVAARLPSIARLALASRWANVGQLLRGCLSPAELSALGSAFSHPVLRWYGRRQLTAWQAQPQSRDWIAGLALDIPPAQE